MLAWQRYLNIAFGTHESFDTSDTAFAMIELHCVYNVNQPLLAFCCVYSNDESRFTKLPSQQSEKGHDESRLQTQRE